MRLKPRSVAWDMPTTMRSILIRMASLVSIRLTSAGAEDVLGQTEPIGVTSVDGIKSVSPHARYPKTNFHTAPNLRPTHLVHTFE